MKKAGHILLVVVLMCSMGGGLWYVWMDAAQVGCKLEAALELNQGDHLIQISIPTDIYGHLVYGNELWYQGCLYDIKEVRIAGGIAFVTVFHDSGEEELTLLSCVQIDPGATMWATSQHLSKIKLLPLGQDKWLGEYAFLPVTSTILSKNKQFSCFQFNLVAFVPALPDPPPIC